MKPLKLLLAVAITGLFPAGCATSYPGTASLWIGMTRAQAIRAMGPPESVSAQGSFEYLNYTLPVSGGGYVVGRPYYVRLFKDAVESFGYSGQLGAPATPPPLSPKGVAVVPVAANSITVLSVEPATVPLDHPTRLKVKLAYELQAMPAGLINLSFNTATPGTQLVLARRNIAQGRGEIEVPVEVTPVAWADRSDLKMLVSLYPSPTPSGTRSLSSAEWDLPVTR
jgi:hypothetical protein